MGDVKEYVVKDLGSFIDDKFKDVEVVAEGDEAGVFPRLYELCKTILPMVEEMDEKARNLIPDYFMIPVSVMEAWIDPACWSLETIFFGRIILVTTNVVDGFMLSYTYDPPDSKWCGFSINVKFYENGAPAVFEFGPPYFRYGY